MSRPPSTTFLWACLASCFAWHAGQALESRQGAGDAETAAQSFDDLLPLRLGNRWAYRKTVHFAGSDLPEVTDTFSMVRGVFLCNDERWFQYEEDGVCFWINNRKGGQYEGEVGLDEESGALIVDRDYLVFRWPAKPGNQWQYHVDLAGEEGPTQVTCKSADEPVEAPAGKFRCVVYEMSDDYVNSRFWFAPGVGLVRAEWIDKETREASRIDLTDYALSDRPAQPAGVSPTR